MKKEVSAKKKKRTPKNGILSAFTPLESAYGAFSYVLKKNGLRVVVVPRPELPVIGVQVTYHVGSRHELIGHTGATHILEHLMFKGSKKFDPKKGNGIWHLLEKKGAQMNATTWCDRTNYYAIVPTGLYETVLAIEADRMRSTLLRPADLASEMTVVRNEYERGENDPHERLAKHAWYQAFSLHPYRIPTIGTKEDIEAVTTEKLKRFYDAFYWPNNATVTVVGNITQGAALASVKRVFGGMPRKKIGEPPYADEPVQEGERRFVLKRKGAVNALLMSFKGPAGLSEDTAAVSALKSILGEGKSSLLYTSLVDTGLAVDVDVEFPRFKDPSLLEVYLSLSGGVSHEEAEKAVSGVIEQLQKEGPKHEDLARAVSYSTAQYAFRMSSVSGILSFVNEALARGDWKDAFAFPEALKKVTLQDVTEAAGRYLSKDRLTVGHLHAI